MVSGSNVLNLIECHQKSIINIGAAAAASGAVRCGGSRQASRGGEGDSRIAAYLLIASNCEPAHKIQSTDENSWCLNLLTNCGHHWYLVRVAWARNMTSAANRSIGSTTGCTITEKAPTRAFSWLKARTSAFTFKTLLRHYAKRAWLYNFTD